MTPSSAGAAGRRLGRYHLAESLGGGPTGEVYRAKVYGVAGFERELAVKRLHDELVGDPDLAAKLAAAARAYGSLEHPRIARLHEYGVANGETFTAVELVEGLDVARLLRATHGRGHALALGAAATIIAQAARAVGYAHGRNIAHFGLCPTNLLCTPEGEVKVTDFGLLAARLPARPGDDSLRARIQYLAPEQLVNEAASAATDVFSLGAIAYELFTGEPAFTGDSPREIAQRILSGQRAIPVLPALLSKVLRRCLARSPFERFPDARALAEALEAAVRSTPLAGGRADIARAVCGALREAPAAVTDATAPRASIPSIASTSLAARLGPRLSSTELEEEPTRVQESSPPAAASAARFQDFVADLPRRQSVTEADTAVGESSLAQLMVASSDRADTDRSARVASAERSASERAETDAQPENELVAEWSDRGRPASDSGAMERAATTMQRAVPGGEAAEDATDELEFADLSVLTPLPAEVPQAPSIPLSAKLPFAFSGSAAGQDGPVAEPVATKPFAFSGGAAGRDGPLDEPAAPEPFVSGAVAATSSRPPDTIPPHDAPLLRGDAEATASSDEERQAARADAAPVQLATAARRSRRGIAGGVAALLAAALAVGSLVLYDQIADRQRHVAPPPTTETIVASSQADRPASVSSEASAPSASLDSPPPVIALPPSDEEQPVPAELRIATEPPGAKVYVDGRLRGKAPVTLDATDDEHSLAIIMPGYKLHTSQIDGQGDLTIALEEVTPPGGRGGIKVRCRHKNRYYVFVDGYDIGQLCPSERIGADVGAHVVEIYDPETESRREFHVEVKQTRLSLRVRVD